MTLGRKWKLGLGIGCGALLLVVLGFMGVATWYAGRINEEYREVRDSEKNLIAATEKDTGYEPPSGGIPGVERVEVFLEVREKLEPWRRTVRSASEQFREDQERQQAGGIRDLLKLVNTGSDLAPVLAGFWTARNEALLAAGMGPGEYTYIYRLVYEAWLGLSEPSEEPYPFPTENPATTLNILRPRLAAAFDPDVAPVELIFQETER